MHVIKNKSFLDDLAIFLCFALPNYWFFTFGKLLTNKMDLNFELVHSFYSNTEHF